MRHKIESPAQLIAWRHARGLSQVKAAEIFRRCRRAYQKIELNELRTFPREIDALARLYEITHPKKKRGDG